MTTVASLSPCLWFDTQAEDAARFYVDVFDGEMKTPAKYGKSDHPAHVGREGTVLVAPFRILGLDFTALNGGPQFRHSPAVSFQVFCATQDEVDHYWERLTAGGDPAAQQCGWLADRFGVSWQVVPSAMTRWMDGRTPDRAERVMRAFLPMKKLDIATLEAAWAE